MSTADHPAANAPPIKKSRMTVRRFGRLLLILGVSCYLIGVAALAYRQRSLVFHPRHTDRLMASESRIPNSFDVTVKSTDGLDLHGWLVLANDVTTSDSVDLEQVLADHSPVVLFFPGNAGDRSMRRVPIAALNSLHAHVLIFDYRGFGDNAGSPTEQDLACDARSVWNYLTQQLKVSASRVVIYGESLGGGSATRLASELCEEGIEPGGLIIQSTFCSLVAASQYHFPVVPVWFLLIDRFQSDSRIPKVSCPILQIHGQQDTIVPFAIGQKLFDAAPPQSSQGIAKQQMVLPLANHMDVYREPTGHEKLMSELAHFLDRVANSP